MVAKEQNGMQLGLIGNTVVRGLKREMGAGTFMRACGGLGASRGGERKGLTTLSCAVFGGA